MLAFESVCAPRDRWVVNGNVLVTDTEPGRLGPPHSNVSCRVFLTVQQCEVRTEADLDLTQNLGISILKKIKAKKHKNYFNSFTVFIEMFVTHGRTLTGNRRFVPSMDERTGSLV